MGDVNFTLTKDRTISQEEEPHRTLNFINLNGKFRT